MKFYANITTDYPILLQGKTHLTVFTTDSSTTELNDAEAEVVALLAAAIFCRDMSSFVNAEQSERYDSLAVRFQRLYDGKKPQMAKPSTSPRKLDWSWLEE